MENVLVPLGFKPHITTIFIRSDGTQLAYVKETRWGETPATPAFQVAKITGESLTINSETTTSSELRTDRNVTYQIPVSCGGFNVGCVENSH